MFFATSSAGLKDTWWKNISISSCREASFLSSCRSAVERCTCKYKWAHALHIVNGLFYGQFDGGRCPDPETQCNIMMISSGIDHVFENVVQHEEGV